MNNQTNQSIEESDDFIVCIQYSFEFQFGIRI